MTDFGGSPQSSAALADPDGNRRGTFVTLEGIDGVGKTTQCDMLCRALDGIGFEVVRLREPGGTPVGERIREMLLDPGLDICASSELLLYEAARAQLVSDVVVPALARGAFVVSDRFYDSTTAYQGFGRQLGQISVEGANRLACGGLEPDRTVVLDMDVREAFARATRGGADRIEREGEAFQARVRAGFAEVAKQCPARVRMIDASGSVADVWMRVRAALDDIVALPATVPTVLIP